MDSGPRQNLEYESTVNKLHKPCQITTSRVWLLLVSFESPVSSEYYERVQFWAVWEVQECVCRLIACVCVRFSSEVKHRRDWRFNHMQRWQLHQLAALYPHTWSHTHTHTHTHTILTLASLEHRVVVCDSRGQTRPPRTHKHNLHRQVWCSHRGKQLSQTHTHTHTHTDTHTHTHRHTHTHTALTATGTVDHSHTSK